VTHLTPDELVDLLDGGLASARHAHLDTCDHCRREAAQLQSLMGDLRAVEVPEPPAFFWGRFSAGVRSAIADQPVRPLGRWFDWPVLAPLAGLALLVVALVSAVPASQPPSVAPASETLAASAPDAVPTAESEWAMLEDLVGDLDIDAAYEAGIATHPGTADAVVLQLSLGEQQELLRLLREELRAGG
jgi:anti-sigma factor RsiW